MKERPILFSGPMVQAILEGRKTQTRRVIKLPSWSTQDWDDFEPDDPSVVCKTSGCMPDLPCPYGKPGDHLWVRETTAEIGDSLGWNEPGGKRPEGYGAITYRADGEVRQYGVMLKEPETFKWGKEVDKWKPSIFMPRWASRITLEILNVRVERLQDISEADATAEGYDYKQLHAMHEEAAGMSLSTMPDDPRLWFRTLWDKINGKKFPWSSNPWLWVLDFTHIKDGDK